MDSFLGKLDPRTKIIITLFFSVLVFIIDRLPAAAGLAAGFLLLACAANIPAVQIKTYLKPLCAITAFVIALQFFFGPGLAFGLMIGCRIAALTALLPLLVCTTGLDKLALGLSRLGLNYRAAYIITAAFNMIPSFEAEGRSIMDAQKLRGLRAFEEGGIAAKIKAYPALAIPLITGAMRRSQLMGIVMDCRGFGAFKTRTWLNEIKMGRRDFAAFAAALLFAALALTVNYTLK